MGVGTQSQERDFCDPNNKIKILNDTWKKLQESPQMAETTEYWSIKLDIQVTIAFVQVIERQAWGDLEDVQLDTGRKERRNALAGDH